MNEQEADKLKLLVMDLARTASGGLLNDEVTDKNIEVFAYIDSLVDKKRTNAQNSKHWADVMEQIADQAEVDGRKFNKEIWHEYYKIKFLPEEYEEGMTRKGYKKWMYLPSGEKVLNGSTTDLTTNGFSRYMQNIEHDAATELGVTFYAR